MRDFYLFPVPCAAQHAGKIRLVFFRFLAVAKIRDFKGRAFHLPRVIFQIRRIVGAQSRLFFQEFLIRRFFIERGHGYPKIRILRLQNVARDGLGRNFRHTLHVAVHLFSACRNLNKPILFRCLVRLFHFFFPFLLRNRALDNPITAHFNYIICVSKNQDLHQTFFMLYRAIFTQFC